MNTVSYLKAMVITSLQGTQCKINTSNDIMCKLSKSKFKSVRIGLASSPHLNAEQFNTLSNDSNLLVRRCLSKNTETPVAILVKLGDDPSKKVSIPAREEYFFRLSNSKVEKDRITVAENTDAPVNVLAKLASDERVTVQCAIAENPNTPTESLVDLGKNKSAMVRWFVAIHSSTPVKSLRELSRDKDNGVSKQARHYLSLATKNSHMLSCN